MIPHQTRFVALAILGSAVALAGFALVEPWRLYLTSTNAAWILFVLWPSLTLVSALVVRVGRGGRRAVDSLVSSAVLSAFSYAVSLVFALVASPAAPASLVAWEVLVIATLAVGIVRLPFRQWTHRWLVGEPVLD